MTDNLKYARRILGHYFHLLFKDAGLTHGDNYAEIDSALDALVAEISNSGQPAHYPETPYFQSQIRDASKTYLQVLHDTLPSQRAGWILYLLEGLDPGVCASESLDRAFTALLHRIAEDIVARLNEGHW
jgi:hypothetical protein